MKRFFVSMMICVLMPIFFTIGMTYAEYDEEKEIINVTINIAGKNPSVGVTFEELDYLKEVIEGEGFIVDYSGWGTCEEIDETEFREKCRYKYEVKISPKEGYILDENSSITINSVEWSETDSFFVSMENGEDSYSKSLIFEGMYDMGIKPFYETEELRMIGELDGGERFPHVEEIPDGVPYKIASEYWIADGGSGWRYEVDALFQHDEEYEYRLTLKLDPEYYATDSSKVNIDDDWINEKYNCGSRYYYGDDNSYYLVYYFTIDGIHDFEDDYLEKYNEIMTKVKLISGILVSAIIISLVVSVCRKNRKRKLQDNEAYNR